MTNKQDELKACEEVITMEDRAYEYGRSINWPQSHAKYAAKYAAVDYLEGARQERALMDSDLRKREEEAYRHAWNVSREQLNPQSSQVTVDQAWDLYSRQLNFNN